MLTILMLASVSAASRSPDVPSRQSPTASAVAIVRVLSAQRIDAAAWQHQPPEKRREVVVRDSSGTAYRLRLLEFE